MKTKLFLVIALGLGMTTANAQIKHSVENQQDRIHQGVKSGELTRKEAVNLRKQHKNLRQDVKLAKADGKVTKGERKIISKEAKHDSRSIYRKKHNERERK
jgi:uncharacterized protein YoaH (UPF0181 family)